MHNRVFNQFGESQLSLQIEIFCVLQRDGVGEGEKERETTVQLYIYQCSEANTRSALGYVLNRKPKRKRQKERNKREYVMVCLLAKRLQQMVRHAFISGARMV